MYYELFCNFALRNLTYNHFILMKRVLFLIVCSVACIQMSGAPVTLEEARQKAQQFLNCQSHSAPSRNMRLAKRQSLVQNTAQQESCFYVFNVGQQDGFVIVSGDDRTPDILGYATTGEFDEDNLPTNMQAWLQGYADQMEWLQTHPDAVVRRSTPVKEAIAPMLTTQWNQSEPYNNLCPVYNETTCVTGCLATAMAQVIAYHGKRTGKPNAILTDVPGYTTTNSYKINVSGISIAEGTLAWNNMRNTYDNNATDEQKNAVAMLMAICGKSTQENYGPSSTSGWLSRVPDAMKTYFGYDKGTQWIGRESNYTLRQWNDLIYSELQANRPVLYGAQSSGSGHAFVVDGYDGDALFHINWGWGGSSNGYFLLSILNPQDNSGIGASSTTDGYSFGQEIVIGAQPAELEGGLIVSEDMQMQMQWSNLSVSGTNISLTFTNNTGSTKTFDYGLAWVGNDGTLTLIGEPQTKTDFLNDNSFTTTLSVPETHPAGTYKVVPVSKLSNESTWFTTRNTDIFYIKVVYPDESSAPTITIHPAYQFADVEISFPGSKFAGEAQPVEVTLTNTGEEYYGLLYLFASTTGVKGSKLSRTGITLQHGQTVTGTLSFNPTTTGSYNVWVATDEAGSNVVIGPATVTITTSTRQHVDKIIYSSLELPDANPASWTTDGDGYTTVDVYSNTLQLKPGVQNISGTTLENVTVYFYLHHYDEGTSSWVQDGRIYLVTPWATLKNGQTKNFNFMSLGNDLVAGKTYRLSLYYKLGDGEELEADTRYRIHIAEGFPVWDLLGNKRYQAAEGGSPVTIDDDVLCADLWAFNYSGGVTPNSNPNTLYLLKADVDVPAGLSGHNVVKGTNATNITLTDDGTHGFFTPISFKADAISYTRTFDNGYTRDGKYWSTIILPFTAAASSVLYNASEIPIDWYHNSDETGKNFWVMAFTSEDGATVNYTQAKTLQANTPYLIAIPGPEFGNRWDMEGLPITFSATNVNISALNSGAVTGDSRKFAGTLLTTPSLTDIYVLNDNGNCFTQQTTAVAPFRAYFTTPTIATPYTSLEIGLQPTVSGIADLQLGHNTTMSAVYDLQGRKVMGSMNRGIYIINGKKHIK